MMYQEFITLSNRKVSFEKYTNTIEPEYMESELSKQDFCTNYTEQTSRTKKSDSIGQDFFNQDKTIKAKKFITALNALSKMVQVKDGDVFYISDVLSNYERGIKKWNDAIVENENRNPWAKLNYSDLRKSVTDEWGSIKAEDYGRTCITNGEYYDYWKAGNRFFRLQIELYDHGEAYIDCGYREED